ncbi:MAG: hypothetical protein ACFCVB_14140 [Nodosilinea sp.]
MRPEDPNFPQEIPPVPPPRDFGQSGSGQSEPESGEIKPGLDLSSGEPLPQAAEPQDSVSQAGESRDAEPRDSVAGDAGPGDGDRASTPNPQPWTARDRQNSADRSSTSPAQAKPVSPSRRQPPRPARSPRSISPAEDVWTDTDIPYQPKKLGAVDQLLLLLAEVATGWKKVLRWVRSQLPPDLQRQLSDGLLTAITLGLLMLLLALWNPLGAGGGERADSEPLPRITTAEPTPTDLFVEPIAEPSSEAIAPEAPAAAPEPTPEQSLIADIQNRVSRISRSYGAGLVQSVEVNLPENTLGINVAEVWYGLLTNQQNEVAQDIYAQAQGLNFGNLQLRDPEGVVVARNPVVGPNMIVLRRLR